MPSEIYNRRKYVLTERRLQNLKNMSKNNIGKKHPHSEETKKLIGDIQRGKKKQPFTTEHRKHISESAKKRGMPARTLELAHMGRAGKPQPKSFKDAKSFAWIGNKNPRWKGGITPVANQIRVSFKYRQWRSDVFTRDNFTCQICFSRGIVIHADHYPKSFSSIFHENKILSLAQALECEEFWNINNGRTLCVECHKKTETYLRNSRSIEERIPPNRNKLI